MTYSASLVEGKIVEKSTSGVGLLEMGGGVRLQMTIELKQWAHHCRLDSPRQGLYTESILMYLCVYILRVSLLCISVFISAPYGERPGILPKQSIQVQPSIFLRADHSILRAPTTPTP